MMNRKSSEHPLIRHATCRSNTSFGSMPSTRRGGSRAIATQHTRMLNPMSKNPTLSLQTQKNPQNSNLYQGPEPALSP